MEKIKAAIIIDGNSIKKWQNEALRNCDDLLDIDLILSCTNTKTKKRIIIHFFYYVLNLCSLKSIWTNECELNVPAKMKIKFKSTYSNNWQQLPPEIIERINKSGIKVIVKFGMGLLSIPEQLELKYGILSFHHGDPHRYRGRPAGFYEIKNLESSVGAVVQKLSNILDGGEICAKMNSKIFSYSYKKTSVNFYKNSQYLLRKAIKNIISNKIEIQNTKSGLFYLPSNVEASKFIFKLFIEKLKRIMYGAFVEKKWAVAIQKNNIESLIDMGISLDNAKNLSPQKNSGYIFYADPFFSKNGESIYAEALSRKSGLGDIIEIDIKTCVPKRKILTGNHYSYPQPIVIDSEEYLLPEMAGSNRQSIFSALNQNKNIDIDGLENIKSVDATYFFNNKTHYIFSSPVDGSSDILMLYLSDNITGPYHPHPMNPVVIDPTCARMGGEIVQYKESLYRLGQDSSNSYGNGITICKITELSRTHYSELKIKKINFKNKIKGPHTINFHGDSMVFDYYKDTFAFMAGVRRLQNLAHARLMKR